LSDFLSQMFTFFEVSNLRAVGMHHHGPLSLVVGKLYSLVWEPYNPQDLGNAMAVTDEMGLTRAYLTRSDAKVVSTLCYGDAVDGNISCLPVTETHVELHNLGPQHECIIKFKAKNGEEEFVKEILQINNCVFNCS